MTAGDGQRRLARIQVVNWGTFDGYHDVPVARDGYLITGGSGSGKSTLLDAISAVLMPGDRVKFNAAAQETDSSGRNLVSYIRGAWRREADSDTDSLVSAYLRDGATRSAVALTYRTADDRPPVTLIKLMHLGRGKNLVGDVSHLHLLLDEELDLPALLPYTADGIDTRGIRRAWPQAEVNPSYAPFARKFRNRLGISSEAAQRLLHRTLSAKSLASLDQLFRDYMLDEPKTFSLSQRAVEQFRDLQEAHRVVVDAREQVEALDPLTELADARRKAVDALAHTDEETDHLDAVHRRRLLELLRTEVKELEARTPLIESALRQSEATDERARQAVLDATVAVEQLGGGRLSVLTAQRDEVGKDIARITRRRDQVAAAAAAWNGVVPDTAEEFARLRGELEHQLAETAGRHDDRRAELYRLSAQRQRSAEDRERLIADREALARRRSNLDPALLRAREILCATTSRPEDALPFAGELLEVAAEYADWTGPIERVLGGLGRTLLVPDTEYRAVAAAIDAQHLGTRLIYRRIRAQSGRIRRTGPDSLVRRVNVADGPLSEWLHRHLADRYDYACVETVADFTGHDRAVTRAGQVKHSAERHEKDDRHAIDDRRRWVLGFDNEDKLNDLRARIESVDRHIETAAARLDELDRHEQLLGRQNRAAQTILDADWADLDLSSAETRLESIEVLLAQWQQQNPEHAELSARLAQARSEAEGAARALTAAATEHRRHIETIARKQDRIAGAEAEAVSTIPEPVVSRIDARFRAVTRRLTSDNIDRALAEVTRAINEENRNAQQRLAAADGSIVRILSRYLARWEARAGELRPEPEFADDALAVLARLRRDGLPQYENRFFELLNEQSTRNLGELALTIRRAPNEIRSRIDPVNQSLRDSPFDTDRWLKIQVKERRSVVAAEFLEQLTAVATGAWAEEDRDAGEQRFLQMSAILERLGSREPADRRWRDRVLDTRLHVGFIGVEFDETGEAANYHDSSAGLSGGQAQKLVFFCLAAALRYQLTPDGSGLPQYGTVILDEAFDRADAAYTRRALDVFTQFGFHLVLATPLKLLQTLEDYIGGAATVSISDGRTSSIDLIEWADAEA